MSGNSMRRKRLSCLTCQGLSKRDNGRNSFSKSQSNISTGDKRWLRGSSLIGNATKKYRKRQIEISFAILIEQEAGNEPEYRSKVFHFGFGALEWLVDGSYHAPVPVFHSARQPPNNQG